jgi:hypothetical protein
VTGLFNSLTVCIINERQQHQFMSEHQSDSWALSSSSLEWV